MRVETYRICWEENLIPVDVFLEDKNMSCLVLSKLLTLGTSLLN